MFKVEIKKDNKVTNQAYFNTEVEAQVWLESESQNLSFGKIEREVAEIQMVDMDGIVSIVLDNNEDITKSMSSRQVESLTGDITVFHTLPAEFTSTIADITLEVLAKKESEEALQYLASTDYLLIRQLDTGVPCPQNIKDLRAAARLKVIN